MTLSLILPPFFIATLFLFLPFLSGDRFFSMPVSPDWRTGPQARRIRLQYQTSVLLIGIATAGVSTLPSSRSPWLYALPMLEVFALLASWSWGWKRTMPHRVTHPVLRSASLARPGFSPLGWTLAALFPLGAQAAYLAMRYSALPQSFPIHFDTGGHPNHIVVRTLLTVFGSCLLGACTVLLLALLLWFISRRSAGIADSGRYANATNYLVAGVAWIVSLMASLTAALPYSAKPGQLAAALSSVSSIFLLLLLLASLGFLARRGKFLQEAQSATAEEHWKAGLWYYNPADGALFVPKRVGFGYTLNMAHPAAWLLMAATVALTLVPILLKHL